MSLPAPCTSQGAQAAERVLDAAELWFSERGFQGTGLREVAPEAGLRAPRLYNHFPHEEALYAAVVAPETVGRGMSLAWQASRSPDRTAIFSAAGDRSFAQSGA